MSGQVPPGAAADPSRIGSGPGRDARRGGRGVRRLGRGARRLSAGARRRPWSVAAAALVAVTVGAVALRGTARPAGDPTVGSVVRVGVTEGDSVPGYLTSSRAELAALVSAADPRPVYALVAFTGYLPPDRLAGVLAGVDVAAVYARVPLPRVQTQLVRMPAQRVPGDVALGMDDVAVRKDAEAADDGRLAAAQPPGSELAAVYERAARIAAAEARAYRGHCACVYAAVVRAGAPLLEALGRRDGVRVVDAAPQVRRLDRAVFTPPLPEQVTVVAPPEDGDPPR